MAGDAVKRRSCGGCDLEGLVLPEVRRNCSWGANEVHHCGKLGHLCIIIQSARAHLVRVSLSRRLTRKYWGTTTQRGFRSWLTSGSHGVALARLLKVLEGTVDLC